jgi:hypothetical protein
MSIHVVTEEDPLDAPVSSEDLLLEAEVGTLEDLKSLSLKVNELFIPEIGKKFYIRIMDGAEVDRYRTSILIGKGQNLTVNQRGMRAKLILLALGNPDGTRMLTDRDGEMVQAWPSIVVERMFDRARKVNGLIETDTDDEKGNS